MNMWRKILTNDEVKRIKAREGDISKEFYSEEEW